MSMGRFLVCYLVVLFFSSIVNASSSKELFIISYAGGVERTPYTQLIQSIYTELGFEVKVVDTPAKRGLMLLDNGLVDADVVRLKKTAEKYPNVVVVEPALTTGYLTLICAKNVECNLGVLKNKATKLLSHEGLLGQFEEGEITAQIFINERLPNTLDMLEAERWGYALYACDQNMLDNLSTQLTFLRIKPVKGFHVINKKVEHLLPLIQKKLTEKLPTFHASLKETSSIDQHLFSRH